MSQQFQDNKLVWGMGILPGTGRYSLEKLLSDDAVFNAAAQKFYDDAEIVRVQGHFKRAERSVKRGLQLLEGRIEEKDVLGKDYLVGKADGLHSLGLLATTRGNYQEAKTYLWDALNTYQESESNERDISFINHSLGELYRLQGRLENAEVAFGEPQELSFGNARNSMNFLNEEAAARAVLHTSVGAIDYEHKDLGHAALEFRRALKIDHPIDTGDYKLIAYTYLQLAGSPQRSRTIQSLRDLMIVTTHTLQNSVWVGRLNLLFVDLLIAFDDKYSSREAFDLATRVEQNARRMGFQGIKADALAYRAIAGKRLGINNIKHMASMSAEFYEREGVDSHLTRRLEKEELVS